jgi:cytochrome c peroxidase
MHLFYSTELQCGFCHSGRAIAGDQNSLTESVPVTEFHDTGLYNSDLEGRYPRVDTGLRTESNNATDDGKFRAPTLRNIVFTAPYMHDGSIATLSEVIDHYAAGGRASPRDNLHHDADVNTRKISLIKGFEISSDDRVALLDFLDSLSDLAVLDNPRFGPSIRCVTQNNELPTP